MFKTEQEFIKHEIELWGFDEIERLVNDGFKPVLTDRGFKWVYTASPGNVNTLRAGVSAE